LERWRRTREKRGRIPESLWAAAVKAAGRHGVSRTATVLRLDYYSLKERVEREATSGLGATRRSGPKRPRRGASTTAESPSSPAGHRSIDASGPTFVELPPPAWPGGGECLVEWADGDGATMRIRLSGGATADLAALSRSFWGAGE
jgi:hypothetical protein